MIEYSCDHIAASQDEAIEYLSRIMARSK